MRRIFSLTAALGLALTLAACGNEDGPGMDKQPEAALPPGPHVQIAVEAAADAHYQVLCEVRTYMAAPGQPANRYGIDKSGPFADTIPSPSAHCHAKLLTGTPPVKLNLTKPGATPVAATITTPGAAGEIKFDMW
jgi:hypothetical protein